jgi:hypothetical protein
MQNQDFGSSQQDTAQERLCSSSKVRTADEIEGEYVHVYSDGDIIAQALGV